MGQPRQEHHKESLHYQKPFGSKLKLQQVYRPSRSPDLNLRDLRINTTLCDWILNFLTGRPQAVQTGSTTSSTLSLNTSTPHSCVQSPLLYSLFMHDCVATHSSNTIIKFADDVTISGLISGGDEATYKEEVRTLTSWQPPSFQHQQNKGADCGLQQATGRRTCPHHQQWSYGRERLQVNISEDLTWTHYTNTIIKSARQWLSFLWRLNMESTILCNFYSAPVRVSRLAASQPCMAVAPPSTVRLYRGWWKLLSTSPGQSCHPWRASTPGGVGRRPTWSF